MGTLLFILFLPITLPIWIILKLLELIGAIFLPFDLK